MSSSTPIASAEPSTLLTPVLARPDGYWSGPSSLFSTHSPATVPLWTTISLSVVEVSVAVPSVVEGCVVPVGLASVVEVVGSSVVVVVDSVVVVGVVVVVNSVVVVGVVV